MTLPGGFPRSVQQNPQLLELDQRSVVVISQPAGADGLIKVTFDPVPSDRFWLVDRLVVSCTSTAGTLAFVYDDPAEANAALLGGTSKGNFDYDDTNTPYLIDSVKQLHILWTGATVGAIATARAQYRLMQRA